MRVLVVEDEVLLAKQLASALRRAGYAVDHASDGECADLLGHDEPSTPLCSIWGYRKWMA